MDAQRYSNPVEPTAEFDLSLVGPVQHEFPVLVSSPNGDSGSDHLSGAPACRWSQKGLLNAGGASFLVVWYTMSFRYACRECMVYKCIYILYIHIYIYIRFTDHHGLAEEPICLTTRHIGRGGVGFWRRNPSEWFIYVWRDQCPRASGWPLRQTFAKLEFQGVPDGRLLLILWTSEMHGNSRASDVLEGVSECYRKRCCCETRWCPQIDEMKAR